MNRIDVTVYEFTSKNFTKHGFLSKRARPIIDDQNCETIGMDAEALAIRQRLPRIASIEAPYVFNHIRINTEDGRVFLLYQEVHVNDNKFITSPENLYKALIK